MNQKKLILVTLVVVVAGAVCMNEFIIRNTSKEDREVASAGERYAPEQIKWEQELARTVSKEASDKTVIGAKPSLNEKFLYEALAGHYQASLGNQGKNLNISLLPNQNAIELNVESLIQNYGPIFKNAKSFVKSSVNATTDSVVLKNQDGREIGKVVIQKNDEGRVLNIEIQ
jgi:hypothetical protein